MAFKLLFCSCTEESILDSLCYITLDFKNESLGFQIFVALLNTF